MIEGPITRSPNPAEEFIDGSTPGKAFDVKGWPGSVPQGARGAFEVDKAIRTIEREITAGERVLIDTEIMNPEHVQELKDRIEDNPAYLDDTGTPWVVFV